jgi:hypothetical protein
MFILGVISAHGQAPSLAPGYSTYILTIQGQWETLGTDVSGAQPITYQWRKDGSIIANEDLSYLQLESVMPTDAGTYTLTASNAYGTATSDPILVEVDEASPPTAELRDPDPGATFTPGTEFHFTGYGSDLENGTSLTHTWRMEYHEGATIEPGPDVAYQEWIGDGESAGYFYIPADLMPSPGAFYRLYFTVEDFDGFTDTEAIDIPWSGQLNTTPPEIEEHPQGLTVDMNTPVTFSVSARFATSYQWQFEGSDIPGATSSTYHLISAQPSHAGTYRVLVSNAAGTSISNEAELIVNETSSTLIFKTNPANLLVLESGAQRSTPYTFTGSPGTQVNIGSYTQTVSGVEYTFSNWAHGGPPIQDFTVPMTGTAYYTINYSRALTGPWRTTEVGPVNLEGSASYNNGTYTLTAAGNDIWSIRDAFRFVYRSYTGDVDIRARVTSLTNTHPWAKAGVMIRNSADPKAMNVMMLISAGSGASFQNRYKHGEITSGVVVPGSTPSWVRIVRSGNSFTGYTSSDGANWTPVGATLNLPMNERVYIGLAATSHSTNALTTATFTNVSVSTPAALAARSEESQFSVYPNPAQGNMLQVTSNPGLGARKLEIVNVFGKVLYQQTLSTEADAAVDIQSIPQGVYVVRLSNKGRVETRSLIRK